MPKKPSLPTSRKSSCGKACASSISAARGTIRSSQNRAKASRICTCSSLRSKSNWALPSRADIAPDQRRSHPAPSVGRRVDVALKLYHLAANARRRHAGDNPLVGTNRHLGLQLELCAELGESTFKCVVRGRQLHDSGAQTLRRRKCPPCHEDQPSHAGSGERRQ